ncbi:MAG: thermonuclease family protein [Caldisericia bacterium]|nr:thermonuclease family protein [Caldisericia bacterium]
MKKYLEYFKLLSLLLISIALISCTASPNHVLRVIDGDTIVLSSGEKIRYLGINTPEKGQHLYEEAKELNIKLLDGKEVYLEYDKEQTDVFGRTLAYVFTDEGFVNEMIVEHGLARENFRKPNIKYKTQIEKAEDIARKNKMNIFKNSNYKDSFKVLEINYNADGDDRDNINGEWFLLKNVSDKSINLKNFYFYDEAFNQFIFPRATIKPNQKCKVFTGLGKNKSNEIYAGFTQPIWNNSGDTLHLYDSSNGLILEKEY